MKKILLLLLVALSCTKQPIQKNIDTIKDDEDFIQFKRLTQTLLMHSRVDTSQTGTIKKFVVGEYEKGVMNDMQQSWQRVMFKYPELKTYSSEQLKNIFPEKKKGLMVIEARVANTTGACVQPYVDAINDCDAAFAQRVAFALLGAGISGFFGSPIAAAFTMNAGIASAYASSYACEVSAATNYKRCQGYIK